jgi:AcrR family transcriptional regulator
MRAKASSAEQGGGRTVTESARRAQIVAAAIEVIADQGYAGATFARIAKQAGLSSTGLISYHFKGKDDLIAAVVTEVVSVIQEFMVAGVDAETSFRRRLRAYIMSRFALLDAYPRHIRALLGVTDAVRHDDPQVGGLWMVLGHTIEVQAERLRLGQAAGEFREFDARVMSLAINGAINEAVNTSMLDPEFDTADCAEQLADLFDRATRPAS